MSKKANPERSCKGNPEGIKWPTDKAKYDKNYLRLFGECCPVCLGTGKSQFKGILKTKKCHGCGGVGYVEANDDNSEKSK